jgi:hypothetical protein
MFTKSHLVDFGNFLFKFYGIQVYSTDGTNIPIHQRMVSDADLRNWQYSEEPNELLLPSEYQMGDNVWLKLWSAKIAAEIHSVHFHLGKVKYDLKVFGDNGEVTRLYNVDSAFVSKHAKRFGVYTKKVGDIWYCYSTIDNFDYSYSGNSNEEVQNKMIELLKKKNLEAGEVIWHEIEIIEES